MDVIGASLLWECAEQRPETAAPLKALLALIRAADWSDRSALDRQFQAVARAGEGGEIIIDLEDVRLRVVLVVNQAIGLVRIVSVSTQDEAGR